MAVEPRRTSEEDYRNISELNFWRQTKVDPMLDTHERILVTGTIEHPALVTLVAVILERIDLMVLVVKGAAQFIKWSLGVVILLITIYGFFGPWIRQKIGLPVSISVPSESVPGVQSQQKPQVSSQ